MGWVMRPYKMNIWIYIHIYIYGYIYIYICARTNMHPRDMIDKQVQSWAFGSRKTFAVALLKLHGICPRPALDFRVCAW